MRRIEELARISDEPGRLTRTFCSPAMKRANRLVGAWMRGAGMDVWEDAVGNLVGLYAGENSGTREDRTLLLGSHLDTVRNAGKFDGALGVLLAIACIERLQEAKSRLPFSIQVFGFGDEEGVRYQSAYLGSRAVSGSLGKAELARKDAGGVAMADAIRGFKGRPLELSKARINPNGLLGYVEAHIEQGPVLEHTGNAVGIVMGIAGQTRSWFRFVGKAGHAGTTPMRLRQDALCASAEFVTKTEQLAKKTKGLVATVGQLETSPNVANVIPGAVNLSLDLRHEADSAREQVQRRLEKFARQIAKRRNLKLSSERVQETSAVFCDARLSALLKRAAAKRSKPVPGLLSGAGHDAVILSKITPVAMLFVRCKAGLSHHPDETVSLQDIRVALTTMEEFLRLLAEDIQARKA